MNETRLKPQIRLNKAREGIVYTVVCGDRWGANSRLLSTAPGSGTVAVLSRADNDSGPVLFVALLQISSDHCHHSNAQSIPDRGLLPSEAAAISQEMPPRHSVKRTYSASISACSCSSCTSTGVRGEE